MKIVVLSNDHAKENPLSGIFPPDIEQIRVYSSHHFLQHENAAAYFDLRETEPDEWEIYRDLASVPVFVHSIAYTLSDSTDLNHLVRINAWPGFMCQSLVEASAKETIRNEAAKVLKKLGLEVQWVSDTPGLVAPRILAMIVNEAYFALGEGVSTREEINMAMKLGTNYPYGPFEWAGKIGIGHIYRLLQRLLATDNRYAIAPALQSEMRLNA